MEIKSLLATSGACTVKLFDVSLESKDPCVLSYTPSPGSHVNCVKWNHTNLVVASAGDDKKISLWKKNGQTLGSIGTDAGDNIEESISTINFSNKSSRYICSGGSGQVVRIWDLQRKRCIKWLKGHTDSISGAVYNCKDEHLASISVNGGLIIHNLASGAKATEMRDPNSQVLRVLDYSRISRHLLVTAGDDGSVHLWDSTGRNPKVSWLRQHSAPASGLSFSPSNDKIIASVGLDKKLYTFDVGSRRPTFSTLYESPFSSLAFTDDGLKLAAGTTGGRVVFYDVRGKPQPLTVLRAYGSSEAVTSLCWQRSKPVHVNESNCTADMILIGRALEDSVLMPDPLPSLTTSNLSGSNASGTRNSGRLSSSMDTFSFSAGGSGSASSTLNLNLSEETPIRSSLLSAGSLTKLQAPTNYNFRDDMELFSPVVDVQPITPSLDKIWDERGGVKKDFDIKSSLLFPSRRFNLTEDIGNNTNPIFNWKPSSTSKQDDFRAPFTQMTSTPSSTSMIDDPSLITPPEAWGGERLSDKYAHRQSINMPSRFATMSSSSLTSGLLVSGAKDSIVSASQSISSLTSSTSLTHANWRSKEMYSQETCVVTSEHGPLSSASVSGQIGHDSHIAALSVPHRFSNYAERISSAPPFSDSAFLSLGSPKSKKTGAEAKEEMLTSLLSGSNVSSMDSAVPPSMNGGILQSQKVSLQPDTPLGSSFTLQLFQGTLEQTLSSFQKSIHEDVRNLHIEVLRQFHMQEMEMSSAMNVMLERQAELMKEVQSLRKENQQLRDLL